MKLYKNIARFFKWFFCDAHKIRKRIVFLKEHGKCEQVRFYPFGRKILGFAIAHNPIEKEEQTETLEATIRRNMHETEVLYSQMPHLSNADFDKFQSSIYPTRF